MTLTCVNKLTIIGWDNGLSPIHNLNKCWNINLTIRHNLSEILMEIHISSFKKIHLQMASVRCRPFCLGLNVFKGAKQGVHMALVFRAQYWVGRNLHKHILNRSLFITTSWNENTFPITGLLWRKSNNHFIVFVLSRKLKATRAQNFLYDLLYL